MQAGDDLRQDQLTLQVLGLMDRLWRAEGLDLCMSAYRCVATSDGVGMLEIVGNAVTLASIVSKSISGTFAHNVRAAMQVYMHDNVFRDWLIVQTGNSASALAAAQNNFVRSCAAYCVATYVLGIGDRELLLTVHVAEE